VQQTRALVFDDQSVRRCIYRPFTTEWLYFNRDANHSGYRVARSWVTESIRSVAIVLTAAGSHDPFSLFVSDLVPNYHSLDTCMVFPQVTYEPLDTLDLDGGELVDGYRRVNNVSDSTLDSYQKTYGSAVTKEDIFFYVYGLLHSPAYRKLFESDLKKMLPRIPKVVDFHSYTDAGRKLSQLHLDYETLEPYALTEHRVEGASYRVEKMKYGKVGRVTDKTTVVYNGGITITGIPEEAHRYMLGSRSAIDWILERYQIKVDKPSGIVNDPNDWAEELGQPRYIIDLLARVVSVSVKTMAIVDSLPPFEIVDAL